MLLFSELELRNGLVQVGSTYRTSSYGHFGLLFFNQSLLQSHRIWLVDSLVLAFEIGGWALVIDSLTDINWSLCRGIVELSTE